jgi:hypothetical protein
LLSRAARAAIAVENELGRSTSAARRRSGRRPGLRSLARPSRPGEDGSAAAATGSGLGAGWAAVGGASPKRARQLAHRTIGSRPAWRTTSKALHPRAERHTPQRRPARSSSVRSSLVIEILTQR